MAQPLRHCCSVHKCHKGAQQGGGSPRGQVCRDGTGSQALRFPLSCPPSWPGDLGAPHEQAVELPDASKEQGASSRKPGLERAPRAVGTWTRCPLLLHSTCRALHCWVLYMPGALLAGHSQKHRLGPGGQLSRLELLPDPPRFNLCPVKAQTSSNR